MATIGTCRELVGTEKVLNLHLEPISGYTMDDYDFCLKVFCFAKRYVEIHKSDMHRVDGNNYEFIVDTAQIGSGKISAEVVAFIPDERFEEGLRTEIIAIETDIRTYNRQV